MANASAFGESVDLQGSIRSILDNYPFSGGLLREILQNTDDARATNQIFLLDCRKHPTQNTCSEKIAETQGPALLAFNNATFSAEDWKALQNISRSSKREDTSKIGKFGIGIRSCYHITDHLQILSGDQFVIFDPLYSFSDDGGTRFTLSPGTIDPIRDHFSAFDQFLPARWNGGAFDGTVVRLPLRTEPSDLREKVVSPTEIEGLFKNFIQDEMNISMLFLQHLRSVEFVVVREDGKVRRLGKCTIEVTDPLPNGTCTKVVHVEPPKGRPRVEKWLVLDQHFSQEDALDQLSALAGSLSGRVLKKHKLRPDVGLAFPLDPVSPPDSGIGQLFTFLRLPLATGFPAHVHGFFSLTPSRQNLRNPVDSGVVKGSDDDILVQWNKILFKVFIPRAWTCLLNTLAELDTSIDILSAWPATQSFTKCGESIYWTSFPENVLKDVIETGAAVWPILEQNGYKDLHNVFFVCSKIKNGAPEALARQGLSICRPPAHIFRLLSESEWKDQCLLTPEHASAALQRHWKGKPHPDINDQDRNAIIEYLLSSGNVKNLVNLPIIPTISGRLVALHKRNSTAATVVHTLLTKPDFELFEACDDNAVFLGHLPPSVVQVFERSGPSKLNVKPLDNSQVLEYLDRHPTRQGVDLATFNVDGEASQFLSRFWVWVEGWKRRSELVPLLESRYLLPESHGMRRAIRTEPLFKPVETQPILARSLAKLGIPFLSTLVQAKAQEKLGVFGFLKTVSDIRDVLKCLSRCHVAGAVPLTDEEAGVLLKHFNKCMVDVPIKDFSQLEREAFKRMPIFPAVQFKDNELGYEKRYTAVDGVTVYGVSSLEILPQMVKTVFINMKSRPSALDPALLPILSKLPPRSDLELLQICAPTLPQQPPEHLVRILNHAVTLQQSIPPKLRNILRSEPYAYASNGFREAPQALIDENSPIRFLYAREPSRLPKVEDDYDRQIVKALSELGLLDQSLSASNVMDRIRYIATNDDVENCLVFLQVLEDHSFNYKSLSGHGFNKSIAWLPTQKRKLAKAVDCRPTWLPNAKPGLFDQVLELLDEKARIPAPLLHLLGWNEDVPLEVLFLQFKRSLDLSQIAAFPRVKCLLIELTKRELSRRHIKELRDILRNRVWVPTTSGKLVEQWQAVFVFAFPGVFTIDSELKNIQDGKCQWLLKELGCLEQPSFDTIQQRLTQLTKEAPGTSRTHSAIDALNYAYNRLTNLEPEERSQLVVPNKSHQLVPVNDVVYDDLGPEKSLFVSQDLHIAHSAVGNGLAVYLGLERLGLKHSHLHDLGEDMGVKTVTVVQKTIQQYTEKQFLPEFLANAQDAGASTFTIIINEFTSTDGNFLYPTFRDGLHKGPSVMIYNDSEFSKKDFDGICQIYHGGKENDPDSIGQFGMGALTMFHITECAVVYSGDEVLFLDPSKKYLPVVKQAAARLPLKLIHNVYPGHTGLLRGLKCFDPVAPRVNGTIFFLPLRTPESCPNPFISKMYSLDLFKRLILQDFKAKAAECLLFIKLKHIEAISRASFQTSRQLWSSTAQCSQREEDETGILETEMAIESISSGDSQKSISRWLVVSKAFQSDDVPPACRLEVGSKTLRVGIAACLTDEQRSQSKFFSMLPLALPTTLPVHVNASFKMSSDRRQIRLDEYDNDDTRFNRWLLTNPLPSVYLALLEGIARSRDNSQWWPGARVRVGYTRDEDDAGQLTTVQEDSLTTALTKAFYSDHLPTSTRRAFRSMYKDDTFDLSTAVLFSHLAPIAVQKVCNTLRPSTLIKLGIEVTGKFRSDKVEVKTLDGKFVKRLLLADGGAETVRQRLDPAAVEELLAFVSEGEGNNLLGLPLLRLQDNTWTSLQNDGTSKHYYSLLTHEYVKNDLFPTNRFVHSQFFPSQALPGASRLLDTLLKSDVSVENLDSGAVKQLTEERLASILPEGKLDWILSFWRAHPFFPSEGLNKSMESLPLVPTSDPTTFKSLLQLKKSEALLIDSEVDCPEWLKSCMEDLGIPTVAVDTRNPPALRIVLRSSEYMASESFFDRFLACLRPIVGAAIQKLGSWPVARQSTFAEWVRSKIESGMEEGMQHVARKLPVWRARRGEEETLCAANNISLLPQRLPLGVGCFSTTFRTVDNAVLHLGIERQAIRQLHKQLRIPNVLEEGEMEEMYKILVRYYLNSEYIEYFLMPNAGRRMVDCEELYPRTDFFRAAFGESSPRFLLQSFANFEGEINHMGLQREQKVGLSSFRNCAQAFYNDPSPVAEKMGRAQIVYQFYCERLPVQVPSGHGAQWHILDGIRFIPRDPSPVRQLGRSSEIELPQRIRDLPSIVSPREVVQRKYFDIAWTQRVALETEPEDRLLVAFPDFGRPTGPEVIAHLKALCQLPRGTIVLHDLKATYQWLSEQPPAVTSSIAGLKEEPIFLNVDDPDVDEWRWSSASQLAFETEDLTSVQGVRQFLLPFRPFLKSVGVLEAYYPEIEADSEHSGALYEQKQFQSFREKLDEQRLSGKFTDVLFVPRRAVKGRTPDTHHELDHPTLRGHRSYLAGCVPWFEDMFLGGFREGSGGGSADGVAGSVGDDDDDSDLDDEDVPESVESLSGEGSSTTNMLVVPLPSSRHVIKALLNYLYTGQLIIDEGDRALKDFLGTLKLAHFLDMRALFDLCQREIVRRRLINPETLDIVRQSIQALDANIIKKWCEDYENANPDLIRVFSQER